MIPIYILAIEDESDREYMSALYFQYRKLMYQTIQRSIHDPWLADDVMQATFEKLIAKIPLLRTLSRERLANYLISACRNNAYTALRDQKRLPAEELEELEDSGGSGGSAVRGIEASLIKGEELARLERVWPMLGERTQYLLRAKYILEKDAAEIAGELKIKPESVRMALTRARREAYMLLEEEIKK